MPRIKPPSDSKVKLLATPEIWSPPTLAQWLEEEPTEPRWVVPGFLPHDAFVVLSGQRKLTNKTYTSRALAASLATGRAIKPFIPDKRYRCLFVEEEGSHGENWDAWQAVLKTYSIQPSELDGIIWSFRDLVLLNIKEWRERLVRLVRTHQIEVAIFDALFLMVAGDENDSPVMREVLRTLQEIRAQGCTVVLLAHLNDHRGADPSIDIDLQIRGSGLLKDAYDLHLAARRYDPNDKYIAWTVRRRGGIEMKYRALWDIRGPALGAPEYAKLHTWELKDGEEEPEMFYKLLKEGETYTAGQIDEAWNTSERRGRMLRKTLEEKGYLQRAQGGYLVVKLEDADVSEKAV